MYARFLLFPLEAERPGVGAFGGDFVFGEDAGAPGVGSADAHLFVVDVEGDDVTLGDVDGVAAVFEIRHEAGVGAAGEVVIPEGGGGEAMAFFVGEGDGAELGEVSGFLWLDVGEEEVIDGGGPATDPSSGLAVGVGFVGAVSEPVDLVVGGGDGALHAEAWEVAEFALGGDGDVDIDDAFGPDLVDEFSSGAGGGDFEVEVEA